MVLRCAGLCRGTFLGRHKVTQLSQETCMAHDQCFSSVDAPPQSQHADACATPRCSAEVGSRSFLRGWACQRPIIPCDCTALETLRCQCRSARTPFAMPCSDGKSQLQLGRDCRCPGPCAPWCSTTWCGAPSGSQREPPCSLLHCLSARRRLGAFVAAIVSATCAQRRSVSVVFI